MNDDGGFCKDVGWRKSDPRRTVNGRHPSRMRLVRLRSEPVDEIEAEPVEQWWLAKVVATGDEKLSSPSGTCTAKAMMVRDGSVMGPGRKVRLFLLRSIRVLCEIAIVISLL